MAKGFARVLLVGLGLIGVALVVVGTWFLIDITALPRFIRDMGWNDAPLPTVTLPVIRLTASPTTPLIINTATEVPGTASATPQPSFTPVPTATPGITPTPGATDAAQVCPNTYPTQLKKGIRVYASLYPNLPNRIREQATTRAKIIGMINPGEEADVVDGPACAEGWIWWKIKKDNGLTGWTAEGDGKDYWILPKP
jgi:hypothetical protein